jgi:hypothetical protein
MVDTEFGHWLAGFIDGEGCFRVHREKGGGYYACHFTLKLRDDDRAILEDIVARTGIGHLKPDLVRGSSKPAVVWVVQSKAECVRLVALLDRFPLRAKKRRDYEIWRQAVAHWVTAPRGNRWHGPRDWTQMIAFKHAIEDARAYPA